MKIINVKTEYLDNPLGLDIVSPRITWNVTDCKKQVSFQIDYFINGEFYSTGLINSSSTNYRFKETFKSRDRVEFVIKCKSNNEECESEKHFFEMGLLEKSNWKANWISGNYSANKKNRYPVDHFKKAFELSNIKKVSLIFKNSGKFFVV